MRKLHFLIFLKKVAQPKAKRSVRSVKIIWSVLEPYAVRCRPSDVCEKKRKKEKIEKEERNKYFKGEIFFNGKIIFLNF